MSIEMMGFGEEPDAQIAANAREIPLASPPSRESFSAFWGDEQRRAAGDAALREILFPLTELVEYDVRDYPKEPQGEEQYGNNNQY